MYNTKPVHLLTTATEYVEWKFTNLNLWIQEENIYDEIKNIYLNLIGMYNLEISMVDFCIRSALIITFVPLCIVQSGGGHFFTWSYNHRRKSPTYVFLTLQ